jgi:hypothetical protein
LADIIRLLVLRDMFWVFHYPGREPGSMLERHDVSIRAYYNGKVNLDKTSKFNLLLGAGRALEGEFHP